MQPETHFNRKVQVALQAMTPNYVIKTQQVSQRGVPDHLAIINGKAVGLEGKMSEKEPYAMAGRVVLQRWHLNKIRRAGGYANWITPETFDAVLQEVEEFCYGK